MPIDYENYNLSIKELLVFVCGVTGVGFAAGILFFDSIPISIAASILAAFCFGKYRKRLIEKRRKKLLIEFRDLLYSIASSMSSGRSMGQALEESIDFWKNTYDDNDLIMQELKYMTQNIRNSLETDETVLTDFAMRSGLSDISDFAEVYRSCKRTGGNLPLAISRATRIIGDKIMLGEELETQMSQKVFEGRIVGLSPIIVIIAMRVMSKEYLMPLYETASGRMLTLLSLCILVAAILIIEKINQIEI